jgi:two-component system, OmpR family, sensor histidine kinase TctE
LARAEGVATLERDFVDIDLSALVGDVVAGYVDRALAKRIDVGAETRPARLRGVDWLLRELLGNLVDNALTYTPAGGVVTVRCGEVDGGAFLEVEDDGPGIPPEERPRVLERFHRVPGTVGVGSGLGLSIVSEIAVLHNGHVEIDASTGGIGTRVRIDFGARRP